MVSDAPRLEDPTRTGLLPFGNLYNCPALGVRDSYSITPTPALPYATFRLRNAGRRQGGRAKSALERLSNSRHDFLGRPTDNVATEPELHDIPQFKNFGLGNPGR